MSKRKFEYWSGVFWSFLFLAAVIWLAVTPEKSMKLESYHAPPQYTLEQFIE